MVRVSKGVIKVGLVFWIYLGLTSISVSNDKINTRNIEEVTSVKSCAKGKSTSMTSVDWLSIAGGGTIQSISGDMRFSASVGQPVIGPVEGADHNLHFGFWNPLLHTVDVEQERGELPQPGGFKLMQNYPNPFNPTTDIRYQIADGKLPIHTTLIIYNILGQEVRTVVEEPKEAGYYTVTWDGCDNAGQEVISGIYFYRLTVDGGQWVETKKMVLLK